MTILDLHLELAASIGDSINYVSGNIPDGVRFSKVKRDGYLNRAQLQVFQYILSQGIGLPRKHRVTLLQRLVPNMIIRENISISSLLEESTFQPTPPDHLPLFIYPPIASKLSLNFVVAELLSAYMTSAGTTGSLFVKRAHSVPIPIKTFQEANALVNSYIVQDNDPFIAFEDIDRLADNTYRTNLGIHFYSPYLIDENWSLIIYILYYPLEVQDYTNITDNYIFEPRFIPLILQFASMYAMQDDQEIEQFERIFPAIMQASMGGSQ